VAWYLDNPEWVERVTSGKYRRERLGLAETESGAVAATAGGR
jgi:dTDP-glucose 4,6-dehydratase